MLVVDCSVRMAESRGRPGYLHRVFLSSGGEAGNMGTLRQRYPEVTLLGHARLDPQPTRTAVIEPEREGAWRSLPVRTLASRRDRTPMHRLVGVAFGPRVLPGRRRNRGGSAPEKKH